MRLVQIVDVGALQSMRSGRPGVTIRGTAAGGRISREASRFERSLPDMHTQFRQPAAQSAIGVVFEMAG